VRSWGKQPKFDFEIKNHIELGVDLDIIDIEAASKVSGARFYYLKNEAVLLEFALVNFVFDYLKKEGFTLIVPPVLIRRKVMEGAGFLPVGEGDIYKIENEDLYLVGTSEQSLAGLHMDSIINAEELPLYYAAFSPCFRTEAGSHGKDTKGIFRVHQFDKIEMFKFTEPEESWKEFERLIATAERIYQKLGLHYRVVNVCTAEMGTIAAKKYDIEVWLPAQQGYREVVSCSNCTDYQSRRLNIRCRVQTEKPRFVHTLNSTACAISRTIVSIMENYQQPDGSILIPNVLKPWLDFNLIKRKS
jgi:seryl-tRNA synthetase